MTFGRRRRVREPPLDASERAYLAHLLERGLPPHHALYRTAREWHVYRWDVAETKFVHYLSAPDLPLLLARLADQEASERSSERPAIQST